MALVFEEQKEFNWKRWVTSIAAVVLVVGAIYFLFFTEVPRIEVIAPPAVRSATELSKIQFDPASVVNSASFRSLRRYGGEPGVGQVGRSNPFIKY